MPPYKHYTYDKCHGYSFTPYEIIRFNVPTFLLYLQFRLIVSNLD